MQEGPSDDKAKEAQTAPPVKEEPRAKILQFPEHRQGPSVNIFQQLIRLGLTNTVVLADAADGTSVIFVSEDADLHQVLANIELFKVQLIQKIGAPA